MNFLFFAFSLGVLFFVLKYRVHIHVNIETSGKRRGSPHHRAKPGNAPAGQAAIHALPGSDSGSADGPRKRQSQPDSIAGSRPPTADIISALVNLGCSKSEARAAAKRAVEQGPGAFEDLLRRAIQEAKAA